MSDNLINKVYGKYEGLGLSTQQEKGIEFLEDFVNGTKTTATLSGYAGTGKTFLLNFFLKNYRRNVCVIRTIIIYRRIIFKFSFQRNCKFHSFWFLLGFHFQIVLSIFIHLTFTA